MKNIVIYSNCQGKAIIDILKHHITFCKDYDIENFINIINYEIIKNKEDIPIKSLEACDLFIHQPIKDKHGIYSTQNIISYLKPECIQISFPYIYNDSFWELLYNPKENHINNKVVCDLKLEGYSLNEIKLMILNNCIDYNFKERFERNMTILRENEENTLIKVADFIEENYRDHLLFHTYNHPTSYLLTYVAKEILKLLNYSLNELAPSQHSIFYENYFEPPMGQAVIDYYKFTFIQEPMYKSIDYIAHNATCMYYNKDISQYNANTTIFSLFNIIEE